MKKVFTVVALSLALSGCASIFGEKDNTVSVTSNVEGAKYTVTNRAGLKMASGTTPGQVILKPSAGYMRGEKYVVQFMAPGYTPTTRNVDAEIQGWYWANIVLGGIIGMLLVDPATGHMYRMPDYVNAELVRQ